MKILATPTLSPLRLLTCVRSGRLQAPLDSPRARFYHRGRYAILQALKALGIGPGDNVAFPAFHCGTELEPFLELGIEVRYYRLTPRLEVDLESLSGLFDRQTRSVFIIHYFGIPQAVLPIQTLCRAHGLSLIEDCAHALGGRHQGRHLGTFGDAAVFSMRKFVPIPDGGALLLNRPDLPLPDLRGAAPWGALLGEVTSKVKRNLAVGLQKNRLGRAVKTSVIQPLLAPFKNGSGEGGSAEARTWGDLYQFRMQEADWRMSALSAAIWRNTDVDDAAARRSTNFRWLLDHVKPSPRLRPLVEALPEGACPWVFPVVVDDAASFIASLQARGIAIRRFWEYMRPEFPKDRFPEETRLREHLLTLPVHQEIDTKALEAIADAVEAWAARPRC